MLIAQLTDTHIKGQGELAYRRVDTAANLARSVEHLMQLTSRPDLVLITGDLTDFGRPQEYQLLRSLLKPLSMPVYVIPGNHDQRENLRTAFADGNYLPADGEFLHYVVEEYPVRLIGLDTLVPGAHGGDMCERRLAWLDARLSEAPERPTLLFMHHPPFITGIAHMDEMGCAGADALGLVVERHRQVFRIVCGHVHRAIQTQWHGVTASIAPSSSHSVALDLRPEGPSRFVLEPATCQLHYWSDDSGLSSHLSFVGDFDGPYPFFDQEGRLIE